MSFSDGNNNVEIDPEVAEVMVHYKEALSPALAIGKLTLQLTRDTGLMAEAAKTYRVFYDSLSAEGFDHASAMQILTSQNLLSSMNSKS